MARARWTEARGQVLLRVHEAGAMLGIGRTKTYELIGRGDLYVVHIDGAARVPIEAVNAYVARLLSHRRRTMNRAPRTRSDSQPPLPFIELPKD